MAETNDISTIESEIIELRKRIDVLSDSIVNSVEPHDTYLKYRGWIRSLIALISWNLNIFVIAGIWEKSELVMLISLMGILISALFITLGFIFSNKSLRVMGIVTLIIYVLKIVVFDISYSSGSNTNIFIMALGGIVCFALSFIYNKLDKIYGEDE